MMDKKLALQLLEKAEPMFLEPPEPTIFSIGGRGYYENVNTDMLAFFMDPNQPHGLGDQILECFFEALDLANPPQELNWAAVLKSRKITSGWFISRITYSI